MELDDAAREAAQKVAQALQLSLSIAQNRLQRDERQMREERDHERQQHSANTTNARAHEAGERSKWALAGDPSSWSGHDETEVAAAIQSAREAADRDPTAAAAVKCADQALRASGTHGSQTADMLADHVGENADRRLQAEARSAESDHARQGREHLDDAGTAPGGEQHAELEQAAEHFAEADEQHAEADNTYRDSPSPAARSAGEAYPISTRQAVASGNRRGGKKAKRGSPSPGRTAERGR